jgi:hypothetical protein
MLLSADHFQVQDGHMFTKKLQKHLTPEAEQLLNSTACPVNFASQSSIRQFASAINASDEPLDLLVLHTVESTLVGRRWYTQEGTAGTAQVGFLGPATLLRLLEPKLSACCSSILLTTSPLHRLGQLDDCQHMVTSWASANVPHTQLALLAYTRQLAEKMGRQGLTVSAVDIGPVREQPLAGSLLRKLPLLHQFLHLLLPSAHDTAQMVASIAADMLTETGQASAGPAAAGADGSQEVRLEELGRAGAEDDTLLGGDTVDGATASETSEGAHPGSRGVATGGDAGIAAGPEPSAARDASKVPDSISTGAGAQPKVLVGSAGVALPPAATADESTSFQAGEALGADIKLLEMLMQQEEGEAAATSTEPKQQPRTAGAGQVGEVTGDSNIPAFEEDKALAASSRHAEAPAGALEDSSMGNRVDTQHQGHKEARQERSGVLQGMGAIAAAKEETGAPLADVAASGARKSFRYLSQGLLATPLLTSVDHAARDSWLTRVLSSITYPLYQMTAGSIVRGSILLDWPVRAWLLAPAGTVSRWGKTLLGQRAARLLSQLQRGVPGVEGVPQSCYPQWVEVTPAGLVMDDRLGASLWQLVEDSARVF